jgi:hypothetical protein
MPERKEKDGHKNVVEKKLTYPIIYPAIML